MRPCPSSNNNAVAAILTSSGGSRVFPGFSFASSPLQSLLAQRRSDSSTSAISRSHEDENTGVYVVTRDRLCPQLLGRIKLTYLQAFLNRYSQGSGLPLLLISHDGFVMLASKTAWGGAALDLSRAASRQTYLLGEGERQWLPVIANSRGLGGHFVTLIPAQKLVIQRQLVVLPSLVVGLLALLLFAWKNRRLHQLLFGPVARFSAQLEQLRHRMGALESHPRGAPTEAASRFREVGQIQSALDELIEAIQARDLNLKQKLRTSLTAAAIAHEINLPLSTIRLLCQQAEQQLRQGPLDVEQARKLVLNLDAESQQVSRVIERMRMLLRNVQTELCPTDLAVVINSALKQLKRQLRDHQVQLHRQGLGGTSLLVLGDAAQLQMAIGNLLRNAIEAIAPQPPGQRQLLVSLERQGQRAIVRVADNGAGFGLEPTADTLLQTTKASGSGLGLFVVRTCVTNHGGTLHVGRSAQLSGAELRLELPLAPPETDMN